MIIGIDPGKKGGIAAMDYDGKLYMTIPMPLEHNLYGELGAFAATWTMRVYMEKGQSMPGNRGKSMFSYGRHNGYIEALLVALNVPMIPVVPSAWSRVMHAGTKITKTKSGKIDTKARSLEAAHRLFPQWSFVAPGCKRQHDGMAEAALIAEYGRRSLGHGNLSNVS